MPPSGYRSLSFGSVATGSLEKINLTVLFGGGKMSREGALDLFPLWEDAKDLQAKAFSSAWNLAYLLVVVRKGTLCCGGKTLEC